MFNCENCKDRTHSKSNECMDKDEILFNRKDAAKYVGFKPGTLAVWDCTGRFDLKPVKIGRSVRYRKSVLDAFLLESMLP